MRSSYYSQVEISNKVKDILRSITAVVSILNPTIRMRTTLNGDTGPLKFGPIPSLTDLVHLPMVALHELCLLPTQSHLL